MVVARRHDSGKRNKWPGNPSEKARMRGERGGEEGEEMRAMLGPRNTHEGADGKCGLHRFALVQCSPTCKRQKERRTTLPALLHPDRGRRVDGTVAAALLNCKGFLHLGSCRAIAPRSCKALLPVSFVKVAVLWSCKGMM